MICPKCHGVKGIWFRMIGGSPEITVVECDYCLGEGNVHCCEGDQEQPDPNRQETIYYSKEE